MLVRSMGDGHAARIVTDKTVEICHHFGLLFPVSFLSVCGRHMLVLRLHVRACISTAYICPWHLYPYARI